MSDPRTPLDPFERIAAEFEKITTRLRELETPTGTQAYRTVEKLSALVNDIQRQLNEYNASQYTNAQVDQKDADVLAQARSDIASTRGNVVVNGTHRVTSSQTVDGAQTVSGAQTVASQTVSGTGRINGQVITPDVVANNITGTRRTMWIEDATGRQGHASSSRRFKQDIRGADIDPAVVLKVEPRMFRYRAQVEVHGNGAKTEYGFIAEELHDLGLDEFVIWDDDGVQAEGIEYSMLVVAQQVVLRDQSARIAKLEQALLRINTPPAGGQVSI